MPMSSFNGRACPPFAGPWDTFWTHLKNLGECTDSSTLIRSSVASVPATSLVLGGVGDSILEPVSVAVWLRWTVIGVAFATYIVCMIVVHRAHWLSDEQMLVIYLVGLFLAFFAIRLAFAEVVDD